MDESDYKLLYDYYVECNKRSREKTIQLLKNKEFSKLYHGTSYLIRTPKTIELIGSEMSSIIKQLQEIESNKTDTQSNFHLSGEEDETTSDIKFYVEYIEYSVKDIVSCEYVNMSSIVWKIQHQPNGSDTKRYLNLLENLKKQNHE